MVCHYPLRKAIQKAFAIPEDMCCDIVCIIWYFI